MLKRDEISNPNSCLNKAADDEPVFVLRAQDELAAAVVTDWAILAQKRGVSEQKVKEALELADAMKAWPTRKLPD
ncbi:MAG: hypothetical protein ACK4TP_10175 [Hyphomicrobium sp.]